MPVETDIASEYRYRNPVVGPGDLVIGISQSGETADTLAAMRLARERGATVLAVTNTAWLAGHARGRRRALHARGPGDWRRRDQDVRLSSGGDVPARAAPRGAPRHAPRRRIRELVAELKRLPHCIDDPARGLRGAGRRRLPKRAGRREFLPLHRTPRRPAGGARGRAQAQGDLLHLHRRLRGRRDEARADRAAGRGDARRLRGDRSPVLEKLVVQHPGGSRARRASDRRGHDAGEGVVERTPTPRSACPRPTGCCSRCSRCSRCSCSPIRSRADAD